MRATAAHAAAVDCGCAPSIGDQAGQSLALCAGRAGATDRTGQRRDSAVVDGQAAVGAVRFDGASQGDRHTAQGGGVAQGHRAGESLGRIGGDRTAVDIDVTGRDRQARQWSGSAHRATQHHIARCAAAIDNQRARRQSGVAVDCACHADHRIGARGRHAGICIEHHRAAIGLVTAGGHIAAEHRVARHRDAG